MHIVLMNQFYPPAHAPTGVLLSDLAETLRVRGHEVDVLCSEHRYGRATGVAAKLVEYIRYFVRTRRSLLRMTPPPDVVVSMTTPPFLGLIAASLKRKRGVPFVLWCMDLYPEALVAGGLLKRDGILYRLLSRLTLSERKEAACIVTLGPDMTRLRSAYSVLEIPVWSRLASTPEAETAACELRRARGWADDETICLYSGNMGRAHRVEEFVALARRMREMRAKVRFVFCGEGPLRAKWARLGEGLFEWIDPVRDEELVRHLLSADVHLVSQQPAWSGVVVPSKYQAACALGIPVLFAGPANSSVGCWISESGRGWVLPLGDSDAISLVASRLLDYGASRLRSTDDLASPFARRQCLERLVNGVEDVARGRK
jgi:colanic acid biosynthesis glycosyl transferase WcaI